MPKNKPKAAKKEPSRPPKAPKKHEELSDDQLDGVSGGLIAPTQLADPRPSPNLETGLSDKIKTPLS